MIQDYIRKMKATISKAKSKPMSARQEKVVEELQKATLLLEKIVQK